MAVHYVKGNLLEADVDYICHQVNCQGKMGSGIAKSIREKWPIVYQEYKNWYQNANENDYYPAEIMLGETQAVFITSENKTVMNFAAQEKYGYDSRRYTSYDAFWSCLYRAKAKMKPGSKIGFPDHIGCCRGGANWNVIRAMIEEVLGKDYEVYIYRLEN